MLDRLRNPLHEVTIAVVGKYAKHRDAYKSIYEALDHAGIKHRTKVRAVGVPSSKLDPAELENVDGILVADASGKTIEAIQFARAQTVPFLGIDIGMQCTIGEFMLNVIGLGQTDWLGWNFALSDVIRRGAHPTVLVTESKTFYCYSNRNITERHRHRYEFDNKFRERLQSAGMLIAGTSPDGKYVDVIELPSHPWFVAVQFHPEFKSQPTCPHPLFSGFVAAAIVRAQERGA